MFTFPRLIEIETQIQALQTQAQNVKEASNIADKALNMIAGTQSQLRDLSVSEEELIIWRNKVVDALGIVTHVTVQATAEDDKRVEKENAELKQEIQNLQVRLEEFSKTDEVAKLQQELKEERSRFADKVEEISNKFFTMEQENEVLKKQVDETIVNPDIQKLRSEKEILVNKWHEYRYKYLDAVGEIKVLKTKLGEDDGQAEEEQPHIEQNLDITLANDKSTKFRIGDIVEIIGNLHTGEVGRIVNIEFSLFKVTTPAGTFNFLAKDLVLVAPEGTENEKQIPDSSKVETTTGEATACNEKEIVEFLKGLVKSKKARTDLTWERIRKIAKRDTNFFKTIQLMRKTARQREVFSELHNSRFADLLVKHIESTGDMPEA